jgi:hypothetical protein
MTISVLPADWAIVTGSKAKARTPKIIAGNCAIVLIGPNQNGSSVGARQAAGSLPRAVISAKNNMSLVGLVSRVAPVHTAMRNCTRDEGRSFEVGNQVLISSHRKLLSSKAMVVNVAEKSERDFDRYD